MNTDPMPDPENIDALAKWLDASAMSLIQTVVQEHTANLLRAMRSLVDELNASRCALDEAQKANQAFVQWAQAMCKTQCAPFRPHGKHAPNCPVCDLGLPEGDA